MTSTSGVKIALMKNLDQEEGPPDNHQCGQEKMFLSKYFAVKFTPDIWISIWIQIRIRIHQKSWVRIRIKSMRSRKTAALV
jgi:hypothetical protein